MSKKKATPVKDTSQSARKIALLGTATSSVHDAPYGDESWEIWNISGNFLHGKRFTKWFEIHTHEVLVNANTVPEYFKFLGGLGDKLMAGHGSSQWPQAEIYPIDTIVREFGEYFTSSLAYMLAYAIYLHIKDVEVGGPGISHIGLWGCDMAVEGEYKHQRPCVEYYLGIARGMGIELHIAPESPLLRCSAKYGFDYQKLSAEMTSRLIEAKHNAEQKRLAALKAEKEYEYAAGVRDAVKTVNEYWNL